jgi:hypothetical protein
LIKAKLVLQPVFSGASEQEAFALYAFAAAAGFSETLIPNILKRTEERSASPTKEDLIRSQNGQSPVQDGKHSTTS